MNDELRLAQYDGEDKVIHSKDLYELLKAAQDSSRQQFMRSGFPTMDQLITGFWGGELTVVSGPTKMGKTTLCQTLTAEFAEQDKSGLWFTYEVPALQFLENFRTIPGFYMPQQLKNSSLKWIGEKILETKLKYGLDYVFIDHLHYIIDMNRHNISLEIGHVMRTLKGFALTHNIHIFIVAHLEKVRLDTEPDESNVRDSSFVGQECDNLFIVWRLKKSMMNEAVIKVALNRRFGVMGKKIRVMKIDGYLREFDEDR